MSTSTEPRVRVGVDTFSGLSESSSGRTPFSSKSADSRMSASWEMVFDESFGLVCLRTGLEGCSAGRVDPLAVSQKYGDLVSSLGALSVLAVLHI